MSRLLRWSRSESSLGSILLLVLALACTVSRPARADGTFISAPNRVDHIHDTKRDMIYISSQNSILRYKISDDLFFPPIQLSGSLGGMDISPDGDTLAVANRTANAATSQSSIYLINLVSGTTRTVTFPLSLGEGGTWTVAYGSDGRLLITSSYNGSGWVPLRRFDPVTSETVVLSQISQDSMLCASGDRSFIGIAESNSSDGPWDTYRVSDGALVKREGYTNGTSWFNYEIGVNAAGTQFSVPTYGGTFVYNSAYQKVATLGVYAAGQPVGVAYHPSLPRMYFPWADSGEVRVYDSSTFQPVKSYDFGTTFGSNGNHAFVNGRAKVSRNGSLLTVSVTGGVRFVSLTAVTAKPQSLSVAEDNSLAITLSADNIAPGTFTTYTITSPVVHGKLSNITSTPGPVANLTYTPDPNYYGLDSFVFKVTNSNQVSSAQVTINVTPVADIPVAQDSTTTTNKNTNVSVTLRATDGDDNALTYQIVTEPTHGKVALGNGSLGNGAAVYTPDPNYSGPDSFTWKANDGFYNSNIATANITVLNNSAPVAQNDSYRTPSATAITVGAPGVLGNDSDAAGNAMTARLETQTLNGSVTLRADGSFTWAPTPTAPGTIPPFYTAVSFTYRAITATGQSAPATVLITMNNKPVAAAQNVSTSEDVALPITLTATDRDPLTYRVVTDPTHGTLSGTAPSLTYTPQPDWNGTDSFTFVASDGQLDSSPASVSITVNAVNDAPLATPQSVTGDEDSALDITLGGTDVDGDALTYAITSNPQHGSLSGTLPNLTYTPYDNYFGADSFAFKAKDGALDSAPATVSITLRGASDTPSAATDSFNGTEDVKLSVAAPGVLANDTDADGDVLSAVVVTQPQHGAVVLSADGSFVYTPDADFNGADSFSYKASDGVLQSAATAVGINVKAVNDAPLATPQSVTTKEDTAASITLTGSDADGDALQYSIVSQPQNGTLLGATPNLIYTPSTNFNGSDSFSFKVSDGTLSSAPATVSLSVTAVNDAPVANPQSISTSQGTGKAVVLSGSDVEGSALNYTIVSSPTKGTLSGSAPSLTYTPNALFSGADSFSFKVNDGAQDSAPASVSIQVYPLPTATAVAVTTVEDQAVPITLTGAASGGASLSTWEIVGAPLRGTLSGTGNTRLYTPAANLFGSDSFSFRVQDSRGAWSAPATVAVTVTPVNDAPSFALSSTSLTIAKNSKAQSVAGFATAISAGPNENSQSVTFTVSAVASFFAVQPAIAANGTLTYQVDKARTGTTTVQVQLKDSGDTTNGGRNISDIKTFTITAK